MANRFDFYPDKHLCTTCHHIPQEYKEYDTSSNWHPCEISPFPQDFASWEDNGSGFWIIKCPHYKREIELKEYLASDKWLQKRARRLKYDGWTCQKCGKSMNLNVHHVTYEHLTDEPISDLITLCERCHRTVHGISPEV